MLAAFQHFAAPDVAFIDTDPRKFHGPAAVYARIGDDEPGVKLTWSAFFTDVSDDGTLGYNYGRYDFCKTGADGNYVDPDDYTDNFDAELKYASPTFVSVAVDGGHFSPSDKKDTPIAYNLNIDMQSGKLLTFADAFPDDALPQLQAKCMAQLGDFLKPEANGDTAIVAEDTKIAKTAVSDLSWWSFGAKQATIVMDPGDEDPYACHFDYAALSKIIKPGFPLPK